MYSAYPSFTRALLEWQKKKDELLANSSDSENLTQKSDDEKIFDDDDRETTIDRSIKKASGSQLIVDQSLLNVSQSDQHVPLILDITPQPQSDDQLKKKVEDLTKALNKKKKLNKVQVQNIITGHKPTDDDTLRVRDILVYDIPVSWTPEDILKQLMLWGKTISMQTKPQRKYQMLHLGGIPVRWFSARWTLKERKQHEKFQATIHKIPDSMTLATLWKDNHPHSFLSVWIDMHTALDNQCVWEQVNLSWSRYEPLTQSTRSKATYDSAMNEDLGKGLQIKGQDEFIGKDGSFKKPQYCKTSNKSPNFPSESTVPSNEVVKKFEV
ncbi:hypothetical protein C1646_776925 [Rhizophagus diaphanus]|nr:hypothetical protein C1646_776925 [Rhizophagus diaphanus] [Rhizophagus sp. MUCL 43196]